MLRQLVPEPAADHRAFDPFDESGLGLLLDAYEPPHRDWFRINFVASVTGSAAGADGTSETLTNRIDRRILGVIRAQADLVLVGAGSVRAEGYRMPKSTTLGIVTGSGRLEGHRIEGDVEGRIVVLCPASAMAAAGAAIPGAELIEVAEHDGRLEPAAVLAAARRAGYRSIVCEGGPNLAGQFVAAGLVDELCLTTSPMLSANLLPVLGGREFAPVPVRLHRLLVDGDSALYARWLAADSVDP